MIGHYKINVTTDTIVYCLKDQSILFIKRGNDPFKDCFALPGGFLDPTDESVEAAATRELKEETNIDASNLKQLYTVGSPQRDPRGYSVSVIFYIFVEDFVEARAGDDAKDFKWINIKEIPELAFDHNEIVEKFLLSL